MQETLSARPVHVPGSASLVLLSLPRLSDTHPNRSPAGRQVSDLDEGAVVAVNLLEGDNHGVSSRLGTRIMELPAVIVGVVVHMRDRLTAAENVSRSENSAIRRLIKRPWVG